MGNYEEIFKNFHFNKQMNKRAFFHGTIFALICVAVAVFSIVFYWIRVATDDASTLVDASREPAQTPSAVEPVAPPEIHGTRIQGPLIGNTSYVAPLVSRTVTIDDQKKRVLDAFVTPDTFVRINDGSHVSEGNFRMFHGVLFVINGTNSVTEYHPDSDMFEKLPLEEGMTWGPNPGMIVDLFNNGGSLLSLSCASNGISTTDCRLYRYDKKSHTNVVVSDAFPLDDLYERAVIHAWDPIKKTAVVRTVGGEGGAAWASEYRVNTATTNITLTTHIGVSGPCSTAGSLGEGCSEKQRADAFAYMEWVAEFEERYGGNEGWRNELPWLKSENAYVLGFLKVDMPAGENHAEDVVAGIRYAYPSHWGTLRISAADNQFIHEFTGLKDAMLAAVDSTKETLGRGGWWGDDGASVQSEKWVADFCKDKDRAACTVYRNAHGILVARWVHRIGGYGICGESCVPAPQYYMYNPTSAFRGVVISPVRLGIHQVDDRIVADFDALVNTLEFIQ